MAIVRLHVGHAVEVKACPEFVRTPFAQGRRNQAAHYLHALRPSFRALKIIPAGGFGRQHVSCVALGQSGDVKPAEGDPVFHQRAV